MDRTIVVGDVHGCRVELESLLRKVRYRVDSDRLIFVGDLIDRGPDSAGVVRLVRSLGGESVRGNHEEKHIRYRMMSETERGYFPPSKVALNMSLTDDEIDFISKFPLFMEIELPDDMKYLVVHAGFQPNGSDPRFQDGEVLTSIRYVDQDGRKVKKSATRWASAWRRPENVIYGHHVISTDLPTLEFSETGGLCVGLDTGCVFGGYLTAYVFDGSKKSPEVVSVRALLQYSQLKNR